jgi:hypothetical protein
VKWLLPLIVLCVALAILKAVLIALVVALLLVLGYRRRKCETVQQMIDQRWEVSSRCQVCRMELRVDLRGPSSWWRRGGPPRRAPETAL